MVPNPELGQPQPGQKTLHVWSKPIEEGAATTTAADGATTPSNQRPSISEAVSTITKEDFANIANTPCARQGLLTGIATGAGLGGLRFVLRGSHDCQIFPRHTSPAGVLTGFIGNATKSANWAVGFFLLGSIGSFEYCQYLRRSERIQMKRHIEVVSENRREQQRKLVEAKKEQIRLEKERKAAEKSWYKFW